MLPARQASVPMLVDKQHLTQANVLLQQINSFVKIGGPILGGAIVGLLGARNAMLLDVLSFALAACVLLLLPSLPPPRESHECQAPTGCRLASGTPRDRGSVLASFGSATPALSRRFLGHCHHHGL